MLTATCWKEFRAKAAVRVCALLLTECWSRAEYTFCSVSACSCVDVVFNPGCVTSGLVPLKTLMGIYIVIQDKRAKFPSCSLSSTAWTCCLPQWFSNWSVDLLLPSTEFEHLAHFMQWHLPLPQPRALLRVSDVLVSKEIRKKKKIQHSSSPHVPFFMSFFFFCLMPVQAWLDLQLTLKCKGRESSWLVWGQNPTSKEWKGSSVERT